MRKGRITCYAAVIVACFAPRAGADQWDKLTHFTFSAPFQVPGATLSAGTYTFKLADSSGNRHIVRILDKRSNKPIVTLMTIPDQRLEPSDKPIVMFAERPSGTPPAVKAWFYPGNTIGDEFVYPRKQAVRIAKAVHQKVLSMPDTASNSEQMKSADVGRVDESDTMDESAAAPSLEDHVAENNTSDGSSVADKTRHARAKLPQTASELELVQLLSGILLAIGFGVRKVRTRKA